MAPRQHRTLSQNFPKEKKKKKKENMQPCHPPTYRNVLSYQITRLRDLKKKKNNDDCFLFIDNLMNPQVTKTRTEQSSQRAILLFYLL